MQEDEKYMKRCFDLALLGRGNVSPNPKVGAVIVYQDQIIGEGYHKKYGQSHAEVNAIASVKDKNLLKESTIYVNLEPCCHWGKTPPCANLIIENKIKRCVISNKDINPKVFGGGIKLLQDNGVEVISGVLEEQGLYLNRRFFTNQSQKRPYVILKYAQTLDGFIAPEGKGGWISNETMKVWVHKQRTEEDAIMVGYNTVLSDNPQLNVRHYSGRKPIIQKAFGLIEDNILQAVITYGKPASPSVCNGICGKEYANNVYELNRLCVNEGLFKNALSQFVSKVLKQLSNKKIILISYADEGANHHGYIYQATNWIYLGKTKERTDKYVPNGKHSRHYTNEYNHLRKFRSSKYRYMYIPNKKFKKECLKKLKYQIIKEYPKGDNKRYVLGEKIKEKIIDKKNGKIFYE
jgi:pyrimidine deaminase RibD-like protein